MLFNHNNAKKSGFKAATPQDISRIANNSISSEDVLRALTSNYNGTYYVNLETGGVAFIDLKERLIDAFGDSINKEATLDDYAKVYASKLVHPDYVDEFLTVVSEKYLREIMAERAMYKYRYVGFKDGKPNYFLMTSARINDNPKHIVVGFSDVNDQVIAEKAKTAELKSATSVKNEFLMNMSHEFLTPLNAIKGFTQIARSCPASSDDLNYYLDQVDSSTKLMLNMVKNMLSLTELAPGKESIREEVVDIPSTIRSFENMLRSEAREKHINFIIDTKDIKITKVMADSSCMDRVIMQLLNNAFKFTPKGGTVIFSISQSLIDEKSILHEIHIKDNGIGMSNKFTDHIFDIFEKEETTTQSGIPGCGLGLPIVKKIVDMLGGTITVTSKKDFGTDFTLKIPLKIPGAS